MNHLTYKQAPRLGGFGMGCQQFGEAMKHLPSFCLAISDLGSRLRASLGGDKMVPIAAGSHASSLPLGFPHTGQFLLILLLLCLLCPPFLY